MPVGEFAVEWEAEQLDPLPSSIAPVLESGQTLDCPLPGKRRFPPRLRAPLAMTHPQTAGLAEDVVWTHLMFDLAHRLPCCSIRACKVKFRHRFKNEKNAEKISSF